MIALHTRGLLGERRLSPADDPEGVARRRSEAAEARDREQRISLARDMIGISLVADRTPVEQYLRARIPGIGAIPSAIRYLPPGDAYAWHPPSGQRRPVMIAAVEHVAGGGILGAHRTWLMVDGSAKASLEPVRLSAGPISGGAIRLAPADETLVVGEGIESTLSAMILTGMPGWAALSTSGLVALILPPAVQNVIIVADHDANGAGQAAARKAGLRWAAEGRRVRILIPNRAGSDANDLLRESHHAA